MTEEYKRGGWMVPVHTKGLDPNHSMLVCYAVNIEDADAAREAVRVHIEALDGDDIGEAYPLTETTIQDLGLAPGKVRMI